MQRIVEQRLHTSSSTLYNVGVGLVVLVVVMLIQVPVHAYTTIQQQRSYPTTTATATLSPFHHLHHYNKYAINNNIRPSGTPMSSTTKTTTTTTKLFMDPTWITSSSTTMMNDVVSSSSSSLLLSFSDQGQNLAGIFFQASLLPYLLFIYFLQYTSNRLSSISNFGFQYVLLFVLSTIPAGIISKATYGDSLANTDWLHGGAETLLTVANIFIVLGLKDAMFSNTNNNNTINTNPSTNAVNIYRYIGIAIAVIFVIFMSIGPSTLHFDGHTPFLAGIGNLPYDMVQSFDFVSHTEPINALSIPTWAIHFSSVIEYVYAMNLIWDYSVTTNNSKWKGLTWGMLPLHASGICACTYHFFYNPSSLQFLVTSQAGLTLLGNITLMIAAFRIATSNGWTVNELNPFPKSVTSPVGIVAENIAAMPLNVQPLEETNYDSNAILATKLIGLTLVLSYVVKYGELGLDLPFTPNPIIATSMIVGIPAITAFNFYRKSQIEDGGLSLSLPFINKNDDGTSQPAISMADVKKYGVAGTVAYILTELAFWIVAFPVAATALYQSTGHWPDVMNDTTDRTAVLAFIFAGANIARAMVPIRFGAALALAPWVDDNIIRRLQKDAN